MKKIKDIEEYISGFPEEKQKIINLFRNAIREAAPNAIEVMSYNMPAYKQNGIVVYFAMHTGHLGFYPLTTAVSAFAKELSSYEVAKGNIRFSIYKPIPYELVSNIVKFRVKENLVKAETKKKKN